eukprot:gene8738-18057_t
MWLSVSKSIRLISLFILFITPVLSLSFEDLQEYRHIVLSNSAWMKCWYPFPKEVYGLHLSKTKMISKSLIDAKRNGIDLNEPIIIQSPCFFPKSAGNYVSNYIEIRLCAIITGMHYIATDMVDETAQIDNFIRALPTVVPHSQPNTVDVANDILRNNCTCEQYCHSGNHTLIYNHAKLASQIFNNLLKQYILNEKIEVQAPIELNATYSRQNNNTGTHTLVHAKFIPTVAIHFRCSDSVAGFLPFRGYLRMISNDSDSIYILTENPHRMKIPTATVHRCHTILHTLFLFLSSHYPQATVVVLQGRDIYHDLLRLSLAKTTICSVSSFCFWASLSHQQKIVYFPANDGEYSFSAFSDHVQVVEDPPRYIANLGLHGDDKEYFHEILANLSHIELYKEN